MNQIYYGIWRVHKSFWIAVDGNKLFTEYLPLALGAFNNIEQNVGGGLSFSDWHFQVRQLGDDGLPTGEPYAEVGKPIGND